MKKHSTKKALLLSVFSLVICFSMLIGTTFAWFTDSVTSANNIIKSGNLDIELEYWDGTKWTDVEGASDILSGDLWEPGVTEVAYLRVANAGSLALKYQLGINILDEVDGKNQANETFKLSDYIMFGVVENVNGESGAYTKDDTGRANAIADVTEAKKISEGYTKASAMAPNDELYLALVVYMPTTVGNVANHNGVNIPKIDLGINVYATQYTSESDSFNNQYDIASTWVGIIPESLDKTTLKIVPGNSAEDRGTITINSPEDLVYLSKLAKEWVDLYSNGQGTNVGSYYEQNDGKGAAYYYHWQWTVELATDLDMNNIPMNSVDISYWDNFEGNGHTISNVVLKDGQDGLFNNGAKAINNLTVKNITVNAPEAQTVGAVAGNGTMTNVHVVNATVTGGKYVGGICGKGSSFVNCSIKDSTVTGTDKTVGGLVGYSIGDPNPATVKDNVVENVTVSGAYNVGGLLGQAQNETVEGNTVQDVYLTSNASVPANGDATEVRTGAVVARNYNATIGINTANNVNEALPATTDTIQAEIDAAASGTTIYLASAEFHTTIKMKSGITLVGTNGTVVDCINLNGASDVTLKNIKFDAAGAKLGYDGKGNAKQYANIITGDSSTNPNKGARNLLIEGCTFTGTFANGGVAICFADQSRGSGQSGNITIKNCTFETTGGYYDIYTYYSGYGTLNIEGNTFASEMFKDVPAGEKLYNIYLGRYQSSTPVAVKGNKFENVASFNDAAYIQDHGNYGVSFDAADNTFGE